LTRAAWRRGRFVGLVLALGLVALLAMGVGQGFGDQGPKLCTSNQQQGTLCLVVSDTPDPVAYSSFDGNSTYLSYHAVLSNESRSSNLSHVGLSEALPAEATFVRVTSSQGACTVSGHLVTCALGSLGSGGTATVDVVVTAPATAAVDPPDETITNTVNASFDENFNDQNNGGKLDTVAYPAVETTVSKTAGQTFVPAGQTGQVDTDPSLTQYGNTTIPDASTDVLATIDLLAPDNFCPSGQVKVGNKTYICREGGYVEVSVLNAGDGTHYHNATHPLVFHLRWSGSLTSGKQTVKNFVVFYQSGTGSPIQVISTRCNATASNLPCLRNITPLAGGGWSVDFVKADNGRMR
jgi:Domain of unknown function DUF11